MKRTDDPDVSKQLQDELAQYTRWANFAMSEFGKIFLAWLDDQIGKTVEDEDKFDVYKLEDTKILYHLAAVRSKRQTLRAIKVKMVEAEAKKQELIRELGK